jgi:hypothetical protein
MADRRERPYGISRRRRIERVRLLIAPARRAYGQPAKLCATNLSTPDACAAASKLSVPTVRRRFVSSNTSSNFRKLLPIPAKAVA